MRKRLALRAVICAALFSYACAAAAQQSVPQAVQPGQVQKRFVRPEAPTGVFRPEVPILEDRLPTEQAKRIRFVLSGAVIVGSSVYTSDTFLSLYRHLIAREISLADMYRIADRIKEMYKADGYLLTEAIIPPQRADFGIVRIEVIEASVDRVTLRGEVKGDKSLLDALAQKITDSRPLRRDALERYILLINDLPGLSAKPVLAPVDGQPGSYSMTIELAHESFEGAAVVDNRGSEFIGPFQLFGAAGLNSVLGYYERIRVRAATTGETRELAYGSIEYDHPIGTEGTRVSLSGSYSMSQPGGSLSDRDIDSSGLRFAVAARHPLVRARKRFLQLSGRFEINRSVTLENDQLSSKDRLRVVRLGAIYAFSGEKTSSTRLEAKVSQGLDILGATKSGSASLTRTDGRSDFTKTTARANHWRKLGAGVSVLVAATGQWAASSLLSSERFGFGGSQFGRAYSPSEITGDHGAAGKVEFQYKLPFENSVLKEAQLYTYYDRGHVWRRSPDSNEERHESAAAAGAGIRYSLAKGISGYFEIAKPLTRPVDERSPQNGNDLRFFFRLAGNF